MITIINPFRGRLDSLLHAEDDAAGSSRGQRDVARDALGRPPPPPAARRCSTLLRLWRLPLHRCPPLRLRRELQLSRSRTRVFSPFARPSVTPYLPPSVFLVLFPQSLPPCLPTSLDRSSPSLDRACLLALSIKHFPSPILRPPPFRAFWSRRRNSIAWPTTWPSTSLACRSQGSPLSGMLTTTPSSRTQWVAGSLRCATTSLGLGHRRAPQHTQTLPASGPSSKTETYQSPRTRWERFVHVGRGFRVGGCVRNQECRAQALASYTTAPSLFAGGWDAAGRCTARLQD